MNSGRRSTPDLSGAKWRSSSYSGGNNECVEAATNLPTHLPIRDSKRPTGPTIAFSHDAWRTFIAHLD
ncbi:DUF397 domain-containing protein [Streptomyces sp. NBC_00258]|uniref:DUF397 domain-containing protein n=1 Tax=Streptomyces sp. NBC_00258 TaxID=2903642 RepID=UPI002E2D7672|nr:DUF397 domain-containing protein [Streptomyces sp. NBC_00258]